jgi:hypothetical protein
MGLGAAVRSLVTKRRPRKATGEEIARIDELRDTVARLAKIDHQESGSATSEWVGFRRRLRELLRTEDPRRFLEWDILRHTMFICSPPFISAELAEMKKSPLWKTRWQPNLKEDAVGCPPRCHQYLGSSGNLVHHCYHFFKGEQLLGRRIDQFQRIVEFGGGYGSSCRLAWRLGFRGQYLIYDLPEFQALQKFYLDSVGVKSDTGSGGGYVCITELDELRAAAPFSDGLFIAFFSLSEAPVELRFRILELAGGISSYLIGYQPEFGGIDNAAFFAEMKAKRPEIDWQDHPIPHLPSCHYLTGVRRRD